MTKQLNFELESTDSLDGCPVDNKCIKINFFDKNGEVFESAKLSLQEGYIHKGIMKGKKTTDPDTTEA